MFASRHPVAREKAPTERRLPPDTLVWSVGDVHGQFELLECLVRVVKEDLSASPKHHRSLVFLGDYIDRGVRTRQVIDLLLSTRAELESLGVVVRFLRGNHEDLLLKFLEDPDVGPRWAAFGGQETLISYALTPPTAGANRAAWVAASQALAAELPPSHLMFLRALETSATIGDYHFVHAGIRPHVPLANQQLGDALWIRDDFLLDNSDLPKLVVHGHTPVPDIYIDHRRICIDTGGYATGVLSALRLEGSGRALLQAVRGQDRIGLEGRML
jgi:serine/threonine protein phosphatase 1